ncbi:MAG: FAD:protein FMN transferase [Prevotellaceae bacterium]|jgi:thiamine biosynthesis lipoprotein|nr:FAD:protein FMN transferase [Prevotellaceae bacterium]
MKFKLLILFLFLLSATACKNKPVKPLPDYMTITNNYVNLRGLALGTSYSITYKDVEKRDFHDSVQNLLDRFEASLSIYRDSSIIAKVNANEDVILDDYFITVFNKASEISEATGGAFDISASPLFEIWGWGAKERQEVSPQMIDSLKQYVGMDKVRIEDRRIVKTNPNITLNVNAIAKGYSSDVIATFLKNMGIDDYLVEIGGEIVAKGKNPQEMAWRTGIDMPVEGNLIPGQALQVVLSVTDAGMATSGNYRRFYVENGQTYYHTIDPRTGYQAKQNILSATVIAPDCLTADAYATAFMVLGLENSKQILAQHPEIEAYFIYSENGENKEFFSDKTKTRIVE